MANTPNLDLVKEVLGNTSWKTDEDNNKDKIDAPFDPATGHAHDGTTPGSGPNLPTTAITGLAEFIRDTIGAALVAGTRVTVTVNDGADTITIASDDASTAEFVRDTIGTALVAGSGVSVTVNDSGDTITIASTITQYTDEQARDAIGAALVAGTGITLTVNDAGDTITIASTGGYTDEQVDDRVAALLVAGANITLTYNDVANTLTIVATGGTASLGQDGSISSMIVPAVQVGGLLTEASRWTRQGTILSPVQTFETTACQEPFIIIEEGFWKMWYTGGFATAATGYATCPITSDPTVSGNWTKHTGPVFGGGGSGRAGQAVHHGIAHIGSIYYLWYADGSVGSDLRYATSTDGITWVDGGIAIAHNQVAWSTEWANPHAWQEDGVWHMIVEGRAPTTMAWILARATSSDGLTWTIQGTGPLTDLRIHVDGAYSGMWIPPALKRNGLYHGWYHAANVAASLPSDIYHATSPDLINWTLVGSGPVLTHIGSAPEVDQVADPVVLEFKGKTYLFYDALDNPSSASVIRVATIDATLAQIIDGSPKIISVPTGGSTGQVLTKNTGTDGDAGWATPSGGGSALTVEEVDGSPTDAAVTKIVFPNGTLAIASHVAIYTPTGGGGGGGGDSAPTLLLDYVSTTDIENGTAIGNGVWLNVGPSHTFTPTNASSLIEIAVGGMVFALPVAGTVEYGVRLAIDLAGTPIYKNISGTRNAIGDNILAGAEPVKIPGLTAAAHTVQVQVRAESTNAGSLYCRSSTVPNEEVLRVQVTEFAPGGSSGNGIGGKIYLANNFS
jgi:hypothetical protein